MDSKLVFCPKCRTRDTFERNEKKDIHLEDESGHRRVGWQAYFCRICGYSTIRPANGANNAYK